MIPISKFSFPITNISYNIFFKFPILILLILIFNF
jgi:hypothetical protein